MISIEMQVDLSVQNSTNLTTYISTFERESKDVHDVIWRTFNVVINSISFPFTVFLNAMLIVAIKRRPRLQSNANIMLACLAVTDVLTGLLSQPSFALYNIFLLLRTSDTAAAVAIRAFFHNCLTVLSTCSCLHLMVVVFERVVAIKLPFRCPHIVTMQNIKLAVSFCWIYSIACLLAKKHLFQPNNRIRLLICEVVLVSCVIFVSLSYFILYFETRRQQRMIKSQQIPQEQSQRFLNERKTLKTTVLVVGGVVLCLVPGAFHAILLALGIIPPEGNLAISATFIMLNSLLNPLIYCWRQKEIRKFVFRSSANAVRPVSY